ncbi:uncharacterized protein LOC129589655 [Paramacrobiotus metropolitanus]|uniref:uncharacterized protein LOC129589655 n=1 Tax=Paramacrobiotus metropolitanus TaxID=2943436 RepID=UPI002445B5CE|nr:uncharacterized protein LOC129589655 [Paramacrobiotus metropolitanus]
MAAGKEMPNVPNRKHILVIALPAFGHYIPSLELAKKIVQYHDVTFVLSSHRYDEIKERGILPPKPIGTYVFDDGFSYNLDVHIGDLQIFLAKLRNARPHYADFINSLSIRGDSTDNEKTSELPPVDGVFCDLSMPMPIETCQQRSIPVYGFVPMSATLFALQSAINANTPTLPDEVFFSGQDDTINRCEMVAESLKTWQLEFGPAHTLVTGILFNSCDELEPQAHAMLRAYPQFEKIPLTFIGPLLPEAEGKPEDMLSQRIGDWMSQQDDRSVVYFSFGTAAVPSAEQLAEIAEALVSLKRPFIWSLRNAQQNLLDERFIRSTAETITVATPYLILHWAPQKQILAHKATGVYVSHCGWNSTLEAVAYGVPVVAWPMFGDQNYNASVVEQCGIGKCMAVAGMKSSTTPVRQIAEIIEEVGGWKDGGDGNSPYFVKTQGLSKQIRKASATDGKSTNNLQEIMNNISKL